MWTVSQLASTSPCSFLWIFFLKTSQKLALFSCKIALSVSYFKRKKLWITCELFANVELQKFWRILRAIRCKAPGLTRQLNHSQFAAMNSRPVAPLLPVNFTIQITHVEFCTYCVLKSSGKFEKTLAASWHAIETLCNYAWVRFPTLLLFCYLRYYFVWRSHGWKSFLCCSL